jgi:hypothetical protein
LGFPTGWSFTTQQAVGYGQASLSLFFCYDLFSFYCILFANLNSLYFAGFELGTSIKNTSMTLLVQHVAL